MSSANDSPIIGENDTPRAIGYKDRNTGQFVEMQELEPDTVTVVSWGNWPGEGDDDAMILMGRPDGTTYVISMREYKAQRPPTAKE